MRGLTAMERGLLAETANPSDNPDDATEAQWTGCVLLANQGRAELHSDEEDIWYIATDLGRLALRVCPVDES